MQQVELHTIRTGIHRKTGRLYRRVYIFAGQAQNDMGHHLDTCRLQAA